MINGGFWQDGQSIFVLIPKFCGGYYVKYLMRLLQNGIMLYQTAIIMEFEGFYGGKCS